MTTRHEERDPFEIPVWTIECTMDIDQLEPDPFWRCQECSWYARDTGHSAAFRAEHHARAKGHHVSLLMDFDDPHGLAISLEEYMKP